LAADQAWANLYDGDAAPEAGVHLCELEPDVAAADDDEVLGQKVDVHDRRIVQIRDLGDPGHIRHQRAAADVDEDLLRLEQPVPDADRLRALETGVSLEHRQPGRL